VNGPFSFEATMADLQLVIKTEDDRFFYDMPEVSPCSNCGVCCKHFRVSFYQGELDSFPLGFVPAEMTRTVTPFLVCMQGTENGNENGNGRCIALQPNNKCAIYANRPTPCREFAVYMADGSLNPKCIELRARYGIPPYETPLKAA